VVNPESGRLRQGALQRRLNLEGKWALAKLPPDVGAGRVGQASGERMRQASRFVGPDITRYQTGTVNNAGKNKKRGFHSIRREWIAVGMLLDLATTAACAIVQRQ
jgi:hypothetical protein